MMKNIGTETVWAVWTNTDLTEGRGRQYIKHLCSIEATAHRLAKRAYVQGSMAPVEEMEILTWDGRYYGPVTVELPSNDDLKLQERLDEQHAKEARKVKALERAKELGLSDEELEALKS